MKALLMSLLPCFFLLALWVGGVHLVRYIVSRFFDLK